MGFSDGFSSLLRYEVCDIWGVGSNKSRELFCGRYFGIGLSR